MSITVHFWVGYIVVDAKFDGEQHFFLLREDGANWVPISLFKYWTHLGTRYAMLIACIAAVSWAAWQLIRYGKFRS